MAGKYGNPLLKHLYVVTHSQATHHIERVVGGWYDSELTDLGLEQASCIALRIREMIPEDAPVEIYASDLKRTQQTADAIARRMHTPIQTVADLREKSYGEAEGKSQFWLDERFIYPPATGNRMDHHEGIPGSESRRDIAQRIYRAIDLILVSPCSHQIIVTHGFALTFVVAAWIKMPLDAAGHIAVKSTSGGLTHLHEDDVYHNRAIVSLNDTAHLG
jgi:probable phosphoglycerate mutase